MPMGEIEREREWQGFWRSLIIWHVHPLQDLYTLLQAVLQSRGETRVVISPLKPEQPPALSPNEVFARTRLQTSALPPLDANPLHNSLLNFMEDDYEDFSSSEQEENSLTQRIMQALGYLSMVWFFLKWIINTINWTEPISKEFCIYWYFLVNNEQCNK